MHICIEKNYDNMSLSLQQLIRQHTFHLKLSFIGLMYRPTILHPIY